MNVFKDQIISSRGFILIMIFAIIIGASVFFYSFKEQGKKDKEFEKSRAGVQEFIDNAQKYKDSQNNTSTSIK